jgi:nitroreductase
MTPPPGSNFVDRILAYHEQSKHRTDRYARGPGGLDWADQPNPFRRFEGAPLLPLPLPAPNGTPPAGALFGAAPAPVRPINRDSLGLFLELSLGLSARKEISGASWFLRMNPSSGNLHPTEAYLLLPPLPGLSDDSGVYHYAAHAHALETRARWPRPGPPDSTGFWVGLTSITWREAWKYGERAFRYCQHDIGHALGSLRFAAATLGWSIQRVTGLDDETLAAWLGLDRIGDFPDAEAETPELLVWVTPDNRAVRPHPPAPPSEATWFGRANRLSTTHLDWSAIAEAVAASERGPAAAPSLDTDVTRPTWPPPAPPQCKLTCGQVIRQRRSAVDFDGATHLSLETFLAILDTTLPRASAPPFDLWPRTPHVHLVLMVHRVRDLEAGLYLWLRDPGAEGALRQAFHGSFEWAPAAGPSTATPLWRLGQGNVQDFARSVSCNQDIAADSAFSLGMVAHFEPVLRRLGAAAYRDLFWETGLIGQALYLAAEAAGVRGTGIGCYFDDAFHRALGITDRTWQSLYHFTVGGPVEDPRLQTRPPYAHLRQEGTERS